MRDHAKAAQFLRTNLEKDESPNDKAGLQTLYYCQDDEDALSSSEVLRLEGRLRHGGADSESTRRLYYRSETGKAVVAQIVPLTGPADKFSRGGKYLAHALVFRPEEFELLGNDPFAVFEHPDFRFTRTVERALQDAKDRRAAEAAFALAVKPRPARDAVDLDAEQLALLLLAGKRGRELVAGREGIAFLGDSEEMFRLLGGVFSALTPAARWECSFDTLVPADESSTSTAWAIGLPESARVPPGLYPFSLAEKKFRKPPRLSPESPPEVWMTRVAGDDRRTQPTRVEMLLRYPVAETIHDALQKRRDFTPDCFDEVGESYLRENAEQVGTSITQALKDAVSDLFEGELKKELANELKRWWKDSSKSTTEDRLRLWRNGPSVEQIAGWLLEFARTRSPRDLREHRGELKRFLDAHQADPASQYNRLGLEALRLISIPDWERLEKLLRKAPANWAEVVRMATSRWWLSYQRCQGSAAVGLMPEDGVLVGCEVAHPEAEQAEQFAEALSVLSGLRVNETWSEGVWKKRRPMLDEPRNDDWVQWAARAEKTLAEECPATRWVLQSLEDRTFFGVLVIKGSDTETLKMFEASRECVRRAEEGPRASSWGFLSPFRALSQLLGLSRTGAGRRGSHAGERTGRNSLGGSILRSLVRCVRGREPAADAPATSG